MITRRLIAGAFGLVAACALAAPVNADDVAPRSYWDAVARKLGRGFANVCSAPAEFIRMPTLIARREGGMAGVTVGAAQGFREFIKREAAGLIEMATFPIPFPNEFQPLVRPEFIYANGDWVPDDGTHNL